MRININKGWGTNAHDGATRLDLRGHVTFLHFTCISREAELLPVTFPGVIEV